MDNLFTEKLIAMTTQEKNYMIDLVEEIYNDLSGAYTMLDRRNEGIVTQSRDEAFEYSRHAFRKTRFLREVIHELQELS